MQLIASAYVCLVSTMWAGTQCSTYMKATALQALHSVVLMTVISFLLFATWLQCNVVLLKCFDVQGASFGQWRLPWGAVERHDSIAVLDWITGQPWCNGKVLLIAFYSPPFSPPPRPPPDLVISSAYSSASGCSQVLVGCLHAVLQSHDALVALARYK